MDVSGPCSSSSSSPLSSSSRCLSFSSSTEWWIFWLRDRDRYTVQTVAEGSFDRTGAVLGLVGTPVVVQRQVLGF